MSAVPSPTLPSLLLTVTQALAQVEVRIRVWSERAPEGWAIQVTDQGVGFNDAYREQLFGLFQRLHAERNFQGTGVGLATVQRIVSRHGGRVLAQNNPGNGATFGFVLPDHEA